MQSNVFFLFYGLLLEAAAVGKLTTALKHGGTFLWCLLILKDRLVSAQ